VTITEADVEGLEAALCKELKRFRVCYKDESTFQKLIGRMVSPFNRRYMTGYTTVMFGAVYFPSRAWRRDVGPGSIYRTLRHEAVHLRDARRFPLFFQLSYLFLLPAGLTFRALWEWRAYAESLRVEAELTGTITDEMLDFLEARFVGPDYLFMFPFRRKIRRRLELLRDQLLSEAVEGGS
jgi:hypothetical protein